MSRHEMEKLLGLWRSDPNDLNSLREYGLITMEFKHDGTLIYTIHEKHKEQKSLLNFKVENNIIITDQPSSPRIERTPFMFTTDGKLVLINGDQKSTYIRM